MGKEAKTNAMRILEREKVAYTAHEYPHEEGVAVDGVTVAASMCFASPFSTPPNALVMPAGQYKFIDYIKVGLPLQIIMGIVMVFALPLLFPF